MEPFMAPFLWALFLALPCGIAAIVAAGFVAGWLRLGRCGRWAPVVRVLVFVVVAGLAFCVFLGGGVFAAMRIGL
jgi:hypothetical protein